MDYYDSVNSVDSIVSTGPTSVPEPLVSKMSSWSKLQALPADAIRQVQGLYGDHFPIEVRCALAQWIEERPWTELDPDNQQHDAYVNQLVPSLVGELHRLSSIEENFLIRIRLQEAASSFEQNYGPDPFRLVRIIQTCLRSEARIIQQAENLCLAMDSSSQFVADPNAEMAGRFEVVNRRTQECEEELSKMQQEQEQFVIQYQESQKRAALINNLQNQANGQNQANPEMLAQLTKIVKDKESMDLALRSRAQTLVVTRRNWLDKHFENFNAINTLQQTVLDDELIKWKRGQQLGGNGGVFENNLEKIQEWCETLAEVIWANRSQLRKVEFLIGQVPLDNTGAIAEQIATYSKQITNLLSSLVTSTFIIEKQPPQVMKTNTRFTSTIRLLVGGKLNVVVIVHGNQEPHAWATVTWDNAFAEPHFSANTCGREQEGLVNVFAAGLLQGRAPFVVPDKVPWHRVGEVLSMKFKSYVGRDLNKDSLHFLGGKAFRNTAIHDYDQLLLTWSQFCKEPLPNHNFTFWEWFYAILKATREHLRNIWNDGTVMGFVGRKNAEELLLQHPDGTFLLRYSDSELGGVTIAWVGHNTESGRPEVFMLQPFTSRDFAIRALADRINDLKNLHYLYPDIPKDQAFSKYYTQMSDVQPANGYVKPMLVVQIPGWAGNSLDSFPNTPQSVIHNPNSPSEIESISYENLASSLWAFDSDQITDLDEMLSAENLL